MSEAFEVCQFSKENFYRVLSNNRFDETEVAKNPRANYLCGYLSKIEAITIAVENHYIDGDYLDDFIAFYGKCFTGYERFCKRIHFFAIPLRKEALLALIRGDTLQTEETKILNSYLGFVIARPLPKAVVGRTVLKTYKSDKIYNSDESDTGYRYYTVTKEYTVNFFGIALSLKSLAFQEQDKATAACATVSLWSCFHKTAELFGTSAPRPAIITRIANQIARDSRPMPSQGLSIEQICHTIMQIDLEPEVLEIKRQTPFISLVYSYLRMGLPVILIAEAVDSSKKIGLHAITLTGYSLRENSKTHTESIRTKGQYIDEFYGHDDQVGPFSRLSIGIMSSVTSDKEEPGDESCSIFLNAPNGKQYHPRHVIIPVYNKIRLSFIDIAAWIARLNLLFSAILSSEDELEWDIFLDQVNEYKKSLRRHNNSNDFESLLLEPHPRFIWRSILKYGNSQYLEVLADATEIPGSFPIYRGIIWHDESFKKRVATILKQAQGNENIMLAQESLLTKSLVKFLLKELNLS